MIKNKLNFYKVQIFIYLVLLINFGINFFLHGRLIAIFGFVITFILCIIYIVLYIKEKKQKSNSIELYGRGKK